MSHHSLTALPSGEKELALKPIGGKTERVVYWCLAAAMWAGGVLLAPSTAGWLVLVLALVSSIALFRTTNRAERWLLAPGSATRIVSGFGSSREKYVPTQVVALAEEESDDFRKVYRLQLEHSAGKVQIGTSTFDRDERALELALAFAGAVGVPAKLP